MPFPTLNIAMLSVANVVNNTKCVNRHQLVWLLSMTVRGMFTWRYSLAE